MLRVRAGHLPDKCRATSRGCPLRYVSSRANRSDELLRDFAFVARAMNICTRAAAVMRQVAGDGE
jgi:hypothetical protein